MNKLFAIFFLFFARPLLAQMTPGVAAPADSGWTIEAPATVPGRPAHLGVLAEIKAADLKLRLEELRGRFGLVLDLSFAPRLQPSDRPFAILPHPDQAVPDSYLVLGYLPAGRYDEFAAAPTVRCLRQGQALDGGSGLADLLAFARQHGGSLADVPGVVWTGVAATEPAVGSAIGPTLVIVHARGSDTEALKRRLIGRVPELSKLSFKLQAQPA